MTTSAGSKPVRKPQAFDMFGERCWDCRCPRIGHDPTGACLTDDGRCRCTGYRTTPKPPSDGAA